MRLKRVNPTRRSSAASPSYLRRLLPRCTRLSEPRTGSPTWLCSDFGSFAVCRGDRVATSVILRRVFEALAQLQGSGLCRRECADVRDESCALRRRDRSTPGAASGHGIRGRGWVAPGAGHGASLGLRDVLHGRPAAVPSIREAGWTARPLGDGECHRGGRSASSRRQRLRRWPALPCSTPTSR